MTELDAMDCPYLVLAQALNVTGSILPVFCAECQQFDKELNACKITKAPSEN